MKHEAQKGVHRTAGRWAGKHPRPLGAWAGSLPRASSKVIAPGLCRLLVPSLAFVLVGCAADRGSATRPAALVGASRVAFEPLDRIVAPATLPTTVPSTRPAASAPLESLQLFAQARAAMEQSQRFGAIQLLEQAIALDPDSYELQMAMGKAAIGTTLSDRALPALQRAAQINPESTEAWILMARLYMQRGDPLKAVAHLRRAMATGGYANNAEQALWVDYLLGRSLQQSGHDAAALEAFEHVLNRLPYVSGMYRGPTEVMQIIRNPDLMFSEIATLNAKLHHYTPALAAIEQAIIESPTTQQYAIARVRMLMQAGRGDQARQFMPEVISRFGTDVETLSLLREVFAPAGGEPAAIAALRKAFASKPNDRMLGFALSDLLVASGDLSGAQEVVHALVKQSNYAPETVRRLFGLYDQQGRLTDGVRMLIEATAARPEELSDTELLIQGAFRLSRRNHLKLSDLQNLQVESPVEAARLYWIARLAQFWRRDELARSYMEKAVRQGEPFYPAYRLLLAHYWARHDWNAQRKLSTSNELVMLAQLHNANALAAELRAMIAIRQRQPREAAKWLLEATRLGDESPEVPYGYALVQQQEGNNTEAEQTLLKLNEQHPTFEPAYSSLLNFYIKREMLPAAARTVQRWLTNDPRNPAVRMIEADLLKRQGHGEQAERVLLDLFDEYADSPEVLARLGAYYRDVGRANEFVKRLEQKWQSRPDLIQVAEYLVDIYTDEGRGAEASRVVDEVRRNVGKDPDLLYFVSTLYYRIGDEESYRKMLEQVIQISPNHSSAGNGLGYFMAKEGRDLDYAEKLVRIAVKEEPDNQAYLDSLGWVMYKRGEFEEARKLLDQAIAQTVEPDAVVLDHLGDALYRTGNTAEAAKRWAESASRLAQMPDQPGEYRTLPLQLNRKRQQLSRKQPVETAPVGAKASPATSVAPSPTSQPLSAGGR